MIEFVVDFSSYHSIKIRPSKPLDCKSPRDSPYSSLGMFSVAMAVRVGLARELPKWDGVLPRIKMGILVAKEIVPKPRAKISKLQNRFLYSPNLAVTNEIILT